MAETQFPWSEGQTSGGPDLGRIHRPAFTSRVAIVEALKLAQQAGTTFMGGLGSRLERETAQIEAVNDTDVVLSARNFDLEARSFVVLTFRLHGDLHLLSSPLLDADPDSGLITLAIPPLIYRVERRDRVRQVAGHDGHVPTTARLRWHEVAIDGARVIDYSGDGVSLEVPAPAAAPRDSRIELRFLDGDDAGAPQMALLRHQKARRPGWNEIGLSISAAPPGPLIPVERRSDVLPRAWPTEFRHKIRIASAGARLVTRRALSGFGMRRSVRSEPEVLKFENADGEQIVALVDSWNASSGTPCVVIPPAWAKTKETLLPLAQTIVATFRSARVPIRVVRFDGIRRRGESFREEEDFVEGRECHHMTFSQGVSDVRSTLDFLRNHPDWCASKIVLVTFSGASIEARKAIADEPQESVAGWVSVVGAADLLSGLRIVSGGQDYIGGYERGVRFGLQRVLGIETNADLVCADAITNRLAHLEDARRQMASIEVPVTWIQGRHDAWIDPHRVREMLSCGDSSRRRLIEVPTGHQLRDSREALDVFQLIASEVGRFVTGSPLTPALPDLVSLDDCRKAERARLRPPEIDLEGFWGDYLLGREELPGMELLTGTRPYRDLMRKQTSGLRIREGHTVADLGSGLGTFPIHLLDSSQASEGVRVHEIDFVSKALRHSRSKLLRFDAASRVSHLLCDLSLDSTGRGLPMKDGVYDSVLASLLINYVPNPTGLLREARRILRPGGRLVVSALRPDTDISTIYVEAAAEIRARKAGGLYDDYSAEELEAAVRSFLNQAASLVDLEEQGLFQFWEADRLAALVRNAGFDVVDTTKSFGDPPQAIIVTAVAGRPASSSH